MVSSSDFNMMASHYLFLDCSWNSYLELHSVFFVIKKSIAEKKDGGLGKGRLYDILKNPIV